MLCFVCLSGVSWLKCGSSSQAMGLTAVCDGGISSAYSLAIYGEKYELPQLKIKEEFEFQYVDRF